MILTTNPESGNTSTWPKTEKHRKPHRAPFFRFFNFFFSLGQEKWLKCEIFSLDAVGITTLL